MNTRPLGFAAMMVRAQRRHQARCAMAVFAMHDGVAPSDLPALDAATRRPASVSRSAPRITASR